MTRRKRRQRQLELEFRTWGGARRGAGRKPKNGRAGVPHSRRPDHCHRHPLHLTVRVRAGLPNLRCDVSRRALERCFREGAERFGFRLVHHSIQSDHLHLIAEASDRRALSRGMRGLMVRVARALNSIWRTCGRVVGDRYHAHALRSPREVRNALVYVLQNARHHGLRKLGIDPCSSGRAFDGWATPFPVEPSLGARATTWLLTLGWRRHGLVGPDEAPRGTLHAERPGTRGFQ
jgi:putative transposase